MAEGMNPIILTAPVAASGDKTDDFGDVRLGTARQFPRSAMRMIMGTGSEAILAESATEIGGALTWQVRWDDELEGYDIDQTDPANPVATKTRPRINSAWTLTDVETEEVFEITSVTDVKMGGGERHYRIHTKPKQ